MNMTTLGPTELALIIGLAVILIVGIAAWLFFRKRRTEKLRTKFGGAEYDRALKEDGSRRHAEAGLTERSQRVESLNIRPLAPGDRARFVESWSRVQARFVDGPGGAVTEADQLLRDVMSTRGYPVSDFEQRAADISVDHPLVMENYRTAHAIAVRQTQGQANTEDLRQAMIHYRTLFEDLVGEPELARAKSAS
jgi:ABC-type nickel/cobalt efflux system permease component RcnA